MRKAYTRTGNTEGQSLVEVIVVFGLCAILLPALLTGLVAARQGRAQAELRLEALGHLQELKEAARIVREADWEAFSEPGTYHPQATAETWAFSPGSATVGSFTRQVRVEDVYRDGDGAIVSIPEDGTLDPATKRVILTVTWGDETPTSIESIMYLTDYENN